MTKILISGFDRCCGQQQRAHTFFFKVQFPPDVPREGDDQLPSPCLSFSVLSSPATFTWRWLTYE
eukprot:scaffold3536_cov185-Ochromonas_danica.AAC.2